MTESKLGVVWEVPRHTDKDHEITVENPRTCERKEGQGETQLYLLVQTQSQT